MTISDQGENNKTVPLEIKAVNTVLLQAALFTVYELIKIIKNSLQKSSTFSGKAEEHYRQVAGYC